jgi:hypothetical protein
MIFLLLHGMRELRATAELMSSDFLIARQRPCNAGAGKKADEIALSARLKNKYPRHSRALWSEPLKAAIRGRSRDP